jgi:hypothetical protein
VALIDFEDNPRPMKYYFPRAILFILILVNLSACGLRKSSGNSQDQKAQALESGCHSQFTLDSTRRVSVESLQPVRSRKMWNLVSGEWIYNSQREVQGQKYVSRARFDIERQGKSFRLNLGCSAMAMNQNEELSYPLGVIAFSDERKAVTRVANIHINPAQGAARLESYSLPDWSVLHLNLVDYFKGKRWIDRKDDFIVFNQQDIYKNSDSEIVFRSIRKDNEVADREIVLIKVFRLE